jgi:hypothetical protein
MITQVATDRALWVALVAARTGARAAAPRRPTVRVRGAVRLGRIEHLVGRVAPARRPVGDHVDTSRFGLDQQAGDEWADRSC